MVRTSGIGLVGRFHLRDIVVSYCNRLRDGEITKLRFEFLVASVAFGSEALSWFFSTWRFGFGSRFEFWAKETLGCHLFPRVGACGRRPSESADPGGSASWVLYRAGIGCTVEKKLYGGRGLGLVRDPQMGVEVLQIGGFIVGKWRSSLRGRFRSPIDV